MYPETARCISFLVVIMLLWLAACGEIEEYTVIDQRGQLGSVFIESTGNIDNSGSAEPLLQDITARREFRHSVDLHLDEDARLDRRDVEERILEIYELPGTTGERLCTFTADIPPGAVYAYEIEWTVMVREGNIIESVNADGKILGTYSIIVDMYCQIVGVLVIEPGTGISP